MLTVHRPIRDEQVARAVLGWRRIEWNKGRALLTVVAGLHLLGAYTLVFAPDNQLFTQGTRPVFDLFPPRVWAVAFLVAGVAATSLLYRLTPVRQMLTWFTVFPSQTVWIGASFLAVRSGSGSAMGVVFLLAVLAFTSITAVVVALDYTSGKR